MNAGKKVAIASLVDLEGQQKNITIYPGTVEDKSIAYSTVQPADVQIIAFEKDTNAALMLNSVPTLSVTPKEVDELVTINIGQGKKLDVVIRDLLTIVLFTRQNHGLQLGEITTKKCV